MPWTIVRSPRFKKRYKQKTPKMQQKVDEAIRLLVESSDPRNLGRRKHGTRDWCYGHDLDFRNRVLYAVNLVKKEIVFLRVCSHDEVYG